jgi:diacylglycerol kinase family enzyme
VVANGKYFGNGLGIAPDASVTDGKFEIVIIGDITMLDYFRHLGAVKKCRKVNHPKVQYHQLERVTIESMENRKISIDMDGEFIGYAPMTLVNLASKINFIM